MKMLAGLLAVGALLCAAAALWWLAPWAADEQQAYDPEQLSAEFQGSACRRLAGVAAKLAEADATPRGFLRALGRQAAGIRPPPRGFGDLARGGRNLIAGRGFLARFDDGSEGQVRHFAGIAAATSFGGGSSTRWISIFVRGDPLESPDGRLTEQGIEFADELLDGELESAEAPAWLLDHLCRRG